MIVWQSEISKEKRISCVVRGGVFGNGISLVGLWLLYTSGEVSEVSLFMVAGLIFYISSQSHGTPVEKGRVDEAGASHVGDRRRNWRRLHKAIRDQTSMDLAGQVLGL